jgi:hypothetical protein
MYKQISSKFEFPPEILDQSLFHKSLLAFGLARALRGRGLRHWRGSGSDVAPTEDKFSHIAEVKTNATNQYSFFKLAMFQRQ